MKKLIVILAAMTLLISVAFAEGLDLGAMSLEELRELRHRIDAELAIRSFQEDALLVFDTGAGVTLIFNGLNDRINAGYAGISVTIVNDSDTDYVFAGDEIYVNGWQCDDIIISNVNAHRRMNDSWLFRLRDANISSLEEVEDVEIYFTIYPNGRSRSRDSLNIEQPVILSIRK